MFEQHRAILRRTRSPNEARASGRKARAICARAPRDRPAWKSAGRRAPASDRRRARAVRMLARPLRRPFRAPETPRPRPASSSRRRASRPRSSMIRRAASRPECRRLRACARRTALREASTSGSAASHNGIAHDRHVPAPLAEQRKHRRRGLLDRAPGHVDQRPIVLGAEPARGGDLLGHRLPVDILVIVAMRLEAEQPVLPDLHDALRRGVQADHQRMLEPLDRAAATACPAPAAHWRS